MVVEREGETLCAGEPVRVLTGDAEMLGVSETVGEAWGVDETLRVNETEGDISEDLE